MCYPPFAFLESSAGALKSVLVSTADVGAKVVCRDLQTPTRSTSRVVYRSQKFLSNGARELRHFIRF